MPHHFDEQAQSLWTRQYAITPDETIEQGLKRVAAVATNSTTERRMTDWLTGGYGMPGGRVLAGAGTLHRNTNNCYVFASDSGRYDTLDDARSHILKLARTTKVGGGVGTNLDPLASKQHAVRNVGEFTLLLDQNHPDAENFAHWRFRDLTRPEGQQWITNRPKRAVVAQTWDASQGLVLPSNAELIMVEDSMDGIVNAAFDAMEAAARGAEVYLDLSNLRAEGQPIAGSGGTSSGAASFAIELFDNFLHWYLEGGVTAGPVTYLRYLMAPILRVVRQGGVRRGAGMATLSITHDDVLDFITCKDLGKEAQLGDISTYNISVLASNAFMAMTHPTGLMTELLHAAETALRAMPNVTDVDQLAREAVAENFTERFFRMLTHERALISTIALHAWMTGEPGLIYEDHVNKGNPLLTVDGPIKATNPCGEITLYPGEPCDLGAINVAAYVTRVTEYQMKTTAGQLEGTATHNKAAFDWPRFIEDAKMLVEYLDDNLDYCQYPVRDAEIMSSRNRRIGAGIMGLGDALVKLGLRYGSDEARDFTETLMRTYSAAALAQSEQLAETRGEPEWSVLAREAGTITTPRRNIAALTIAPTGTTSMLLGVSSGIEPIFSPFIYRKIGADYVSILHPLFKAEMEKHAPHPDFMRLEDLGTEYRDHWDWDKVVAALQTGHGSIQDFDWIPAELKRVFVFAHDITINEHVIMQAAAQKGMDHHGLGNAISKTLNLPEGAPITDILSAYTLSHKLQCKGSTVYRDGSRRFQVLSTSKDEAQEEETTEEPVTEMSEPTAPAPRLALHQKIRIGGDTWYVNPGFENGRIVEVFLAPPKGDAFLATTANVVGRLISHLLQAGVPLQDVIHTLRGQHDHTGGLLTGLTEKSTFVRSIYDGLAEALDHLQQLAPHDPREASWQNPALQAFIQDAVANTQALNRAESDVNATETTGLQYCIECKKKQFNKAECVCYHCGSTRCG